MPLELNDDQLLVKVEAASVNALDVDMVHGYGQQLFESVRPLPAVLGTLFSATSLFRVPINSAQVATSPALWWRRVLACGTTRYELRTQRANT